MPQTKSKAAVAYCEELTRSNNIESSGVQFTFSSIVGRRDSVILGLRHIASGSPEVATIDIPLDVFVKARAIYKKVERGKVRWSASINDLGAMNRIFTEYRPALTALNEAVRKTAAAAPPPPIPAPVIEPDVRTISLDVRAPSEQLVRAAEEVLEQKGDEPELEDEILDETAERAYGPVDPSLSDKELAKAIAKRRKAARKAFKAAMKRRKALVTTTMSVTPASNISAIHSMLLGLVNKLPESEQASAMREILNAGTNVAELNRIGKELAEKNVRIIQQRSATEDYVKPKTKSRKQVMKMVRRLNVDEPEEDETAKRLHLTAEQALKLRDQLNRIYGTQ